MNPIGMAGFASAIVFANTMGVAVATATECTMCREGNMAFPNRVVPISGGLTCSELEATTLKPLPIHACEWQRHVLSRAIDVLAFCGCYESAQPILCSVCDSDGLVSIFRGSTQESTASCSDLTIAVDYVKDPLVCEAVAIFSGNCCNVVKETLDLPQTPCSLCGNENIPLTNPDHGLPTKKGFTCMDARDMAGFFMAGTKVCTDIFVPLAPGCCKTEHRCSVCADPSSKLHFPSRQIPFFQQGMTCSDVEYGLGYINQEQCSSFHAATSSVDLGAWCGCEDAAQNAVSACSLCGSEWVVTKKTTQIPGAPRGVTCQIIHEWAPSVRDMAYCESHISPLRSSCCGEAPSTLAPTADEAPPSPSPTSDEAPPTQSPTSAEASPTPIPTSVPAPEEKVATHVPDIIPKFELESRSSAATCRRPVFGLNIAILGLLSIAAFAHHPTV